METIDAGEQPEPHLVAVFGEPESTCFRDDMKQVFGMALRKATFNAMRFCACFAADRGQKGRAPGCDDERSSSLFRRSRTARALIKKDNCWRQSMHPAPAKVDLKGRMFW